MLKRSHIGRSTSTLRLVVSHDSPPDDGYGKIPSTSVQEMHRRKSLKDLRALHRLRRINEPFDMWIEGPDGIDIRKVYSPHVLGWKASFTVAEDIAFKVTNKRFPLIHPHNETAAQTRKRRHAFNVKLRRESVHAQANTTAAKKPQVTRLQSLVNALPAAPGRTTVKDVATKLQKHPAWRNEFDGSKMEVISITKQINMMMRVRPDLFRTIIEYPQKLGQQPKRFIWRG